MIVTLLALLACVQPSGDFGAATFTVNERVPTVINAGWTSAEGGEAYLEWGYDDRLTERTAPVTVEAGEQSLRLIGPAAGSRVYVRGVVETDDGDRLTSEVHVIDLPLAPALMARLYADGAPSQDGSLLTTIFMMESPWVVLLNPAGEAIWYYPLPPLTPTTSVQATRDGEGLLILLVEPPNSDRTTRVMRVSWDGELQGTLELPTGHHDFRELPDGRIAWLSTEVREVAVDGQLRLVMGDAVRVSEWDEDVGATLSEPPLISLFDALPAPTGLCEHQSRFMEHDGELVLDWTHANSIDYDPDTEELIVLTHFLDAIVSVPVTGGEAKVFGRLSGYNTPNGEAPFSHAHSSMLRSDHALLFDNGLHYNPPLSRLVSVSWDERDHTIWEDWSFEDPNAGVVHVLGDAQPTPSGGALASYSTQGRIIEVTERGEVVWTLESEAGAGLGRLLWVDQF
ncbi:MAG: aryl-sulfate sulfotransferase [Deltaproteobacteria bacterium]|nr:aryl-sulfate sulfotransferase [Deltaproteobacteria bacterium]